MIDRVLRALLGALVRATLKPVLGARLPVRWQRAVMNATYFTTRRTASVAIRIEPLGGVPAERVERSPAAGGAAILYLHGGGYCIGSPRTQRPITTALAAAADLPVYVPDYRLAPEHPFPAALDDALAAYRALCARFDRLVVAGDSAGGGLALALAHAAREAGLRSPVALLLISPWVDLACTGSTLASRARRDPMLTPAGLRRWATLYAGDRIRDPRCSPLLADPAGLPPTLIQTGTEEILHDDSARLRERLVAAGVECRMTEHAGLWHDFQMHAGVLDAADRAIGELAAFARERLERRPAPGNATPRTA